MTENLSLSPSQGERIGPVSSSGNATGMIPETVVELLAQMISFDTVNEHVSLRVFTEKALLESLENTAQRWGLSTERLQISASPADEAFNLLITHVANENAPWLLFESHADTVSVEGMTIDPFNSLVAKFVPLNNKPELVGSTESLTSIISSASFQTQLLPGWQTTK
jgi:hypothetical protein